MIFWRALAKPLSVPVLTKPHFSITLWEPIWSARLRGELNKRFKRSGIRADWEQQLACVRGTNIGAYDTGLGLEFIHQPDVVCDERLANARRRDEQEVVVREDCLHFAANPDPALQRG